ncbi:effector-associated constant component EACC1 [Streptomyces scabiei]|uniref:effector-associated constant component EACC1 n=1 Tax=Streptomyces scabiei TaxID=1930 RepID=UPI0039F447CA
MLDARSESSLDGDGVDLIISLPGESEAASLAAWLRGDSSLTERVRIVHGPPLQIQLTVVGPLTLASTVEAVMVWLHQRREPLELTIQGPSGQTVVLTASSPEDAAELSRILAAPESQQRDESTTTADEIIVPLDNSSPTPPYQHGSSTIGRHTPPGPVLDPDDDWPRLGEK